MKKLILIILISLISILSIYYCFDHFKERDLTYVVERKLTNGIFNKHKLGSIESFQLAYSDDTISIMIVNGVKSNNAHNSVTYKILLEKNKSSNWKVKEIYEIK